MAETFYSILGVDPEADTETIQAAYRELVKTHHPDVSDEDDAVEEFKRITQARDILVDETSRRQYDRVGHDTYVRRYMDGNAWTVDHETRTSTTGQSGSRADAGTGRTDAGESTGRRTDGSRSRSPGPGAGSGSRRSDTSETAHDYDRYRSQYTAEETHDAGRYKDDWQDRSWTDDFDWAPDDDETTAAGATGNGDDTIGGDGWQQAQATATGYRPTGHDGTEGTANQTAAGGIQPALRSIGPWLAFHFVFLMSAFVTVYLLITEFTSVEGVFVSLIMLGAAVFFSVLHMLSRVYS